MGATEGKARKTTAGRKPADAPRVVPHLTTHERAARGRAARAEVPRSSHAVFTPAPGRRDPVELLESQAETRVPELVPIRYGRMLSSAFAFYRGAALIMASDLAGSPQSGLHVQLCGDAHLSNFGVFASPERRLVFDLNDFDETLPGPWEWDVKRLAASFAVAGRELGFSTKERRAVVMEAVGSYRRAIREFGGMRTMDVWYARLEVDELLTSLRSEMKKGMVRRTEQTLGKARTRDSMAAFSKLTEIVDGEPRIAADPPLIVPLRDLVALGDVELDHDQVLETLQELVRRFRATLQNDRRALLEQFRLVDVAHKVVGVGSVGTRAWIALLVGRDEDDPLFLQFKEAQSSVLEGFTAASAYSNHGERVVSGQRLMQASSDIFLGWFTTDRGFDGRPRDFYGRQLKDWKGSFDAAGATPQGTVLYARICGWTLARAHARSGDRIAIGAYLGSGDTFDRAIAEFSEAYADQNERDHKALSAAAAQGRIAIRTDI